MKNCLRSTAKPKNTHELWMGIKAFWKTMTSSQRSYKLMVHLVDIDTVVKYFYYTVNAHVLILVSKFHVYNTLVHYSAVYNMSV